MQLMDAVIESLAEQEAEEMSTDESGTVTLTKEAVVFLLAESARCRLARQGLYNFEETPGEYP